MISYNINDIKWYFQNFEEFIKGKERFSINEFENFIGSIEDTKNSPRFTYNFGATKGVIVPKHSNYVIKIPFNGEEDWDADWHSFMFGGGNNDCDYCALEQELYEGIGKKYPQYLRFFLPNLSIEKEININYPIYLQEKVSIFEEVEYNSSFFCSRPSRQRIRKYRKEANQPSHLLHLPLDWSGRCLEVLNNDISELEEFFNFLKAEHLYEDLHKQNIGYNSKNEPIILDYATYRD